MWSGPSRESADSGLPSQDRSWGWRLLVPGWPQWAWRQPERAAFFLGSYLTAVAVGLFSWGTPVGAVILLAAFAMHVAATADAVAQWTFPGFGRFVPLATAGAGLGVGCYGPVVALAAVLAWPCEPSNTPGQGFLVNRWAYRDRAPESGDWIWYDLPEGGGRGVGVLLAEGRQKVQWNGGQLKVEGIVPDWQPGPPALNLRAVAFVVPPDQILVDPWGQGTHDEALLGLILVDRRDVQGQAWARYAPVWDRKLLR